MCFYFLIFSYGIFLHMTMEFFFNQPVMEQLFRYAQWVGQTAVGFAEMF